MFAKFSDVENKPSLCCTYGTEWSQLFPHLPWAPASLSYVEEIHAVAYLDLAALLIREPCASPDKQQKNKKIKIKIESCHLQQWEGSCSPSASPLLAWLIHWAVQLSGTPALIGKAERSCADHHPGPKCSCYQRCCSAWLKLRLC